MRGPTKRRFDEIFDKGRRVQGKFCRLSAIPGDGKIGFATAKKIGSHPRRNQIRRRFQAALREIAFNPNPPLDLIVIIAAGACDVGSVEIRRELETLLNQIERRWAGESECS